MRLNLTLLSLSLLALSGISTAYAIPNPASQFCTNTGGTSRILTATGGGQSGLCYFDNGAIGEWTLFNQNHDSPTLAAQAFCQNTGSVSSEHSSNTGIANPASEYCATQGGSFEILKDAQGAELGVCKFSDKSVIEEWTLFRGPTSNSKLSQALDCNSLHN